MRRKTPPFRAVFVKRPGQRYSFCCGVPRTPVYSRALELDAETAGEIIYLQDLLDY